MRRLLWPLLLIAVAAAVTVVLVPTLTIHPFRPQTTRGVELSYTLKRAAPVVTAIALAMALASALMLWGGARRWWRRGVIVDAEVVMSIDVKGAALAYPVRQLAYHHLVNDVVGGRPLVATY